MQRWAKSGNVYRCPSTIATDTIEDAIFPDYWCNLLDHDSEEKAATNGEEEVVHLGSTKHHGNAKINSRSDAFNAGKG